MRLGASVNAEATHFAVRAPRAEALDLCLFDGDGERRLPMAREGDVWRLSVPGALAGTPYGYRAHGPRAPERGLWFDPAKLLVDPYAAELDRRFRTSPRLALFGEDTADIVPRALVPGAMPLAPRRPPLPVQGGFIYEAHVRGLTMLHPEVPEPLRGTVAALAHPAIIAHLRKLHVSAIELMPIVAWIDERHLPPLGLANYWGYNPVAPMALDPGLCPGGMAELAQTVEALHAAGIAVILDLVFNHTGESDAHGAVLCLRGLDNAAYAHGPDGALINDTGCGNTLDFGYPPLRAMVLDALRHFVRHAGVDGFRFDLAPVLARGPDFNPAAPIFAEIAQDPLLADRILIAEPWDIGPGGYQLGRFPAGWLEWNDAFRDDLRRFWLGGGGLGQLATRLAGSADIFGEQACRSVNFLAAHDGFTLADTLAYNERHNLANGEGGRDGHGQNHSWNHGTEGRTCDPAILAARRASAEAMLASLFASAGTVMLSAGDEFGRSQQGNNNAYCQDGPIGWVDWASRDVALEDHVARLAATRAAARGAMAQFPRAGEWHRPDGAAMTAGDWESPETRGFTYVSHDDERPLTLRIDRGARLAQFSVESRAAAVRPA